MSLTPNILCHQIEISWIGSAGLEIATSRPFIVSAYHPAEQLMIPWTWETVGNSAYASIDIWLRNCVNDGGKAYAIRFTTINTIWEITDVE